MMPASTSLFMSAAFPPVTTLTLDTEVIIRPRTRVVPATGAGAPEGAIEVITDGLSASYVLTASLVAALAAHEETKRRWNNLDDTYREQRETIEKQRKLADVEYTMRLLEGQSNSIKEREETIEALEGQLSSMVSSQDLQIRDLKERVALLEDTIDLERARNALGYVGRTDETVAAACATIADVKRRRGGGWEGAR
jgi:hypothetical protein